MTPSDFREGFPGRLVPTIDGAFAFAPSPVLRTMNLDSVSRQLSRADRALGRLSGTSGRLVSPMLIGSPLLHREAILSSRIEGTVTTPEELVLFEAGTPQPGGPSREEDTREVLNYVRAMRQALHRLRELPISLRLIKEVHAKLMEGVRGDDECPGEFRRTQNFIGRRGQRIGDARFVPPPVSEMKTALDDFERALDEQFTMADPLPLLVHLALVHYQFETIHPFRDGNGRIGRLLIPLLLCSHKILDEPLLYVSSYFETRRQDYGDLMLAVSQRGDWSAWINFFLAAIEQCALEACDQADGLLKLRQRYHERFHEARSSALLLKLIDELFQRPSITIGRAAAVLDVTFAAASSSIKKLEEAGILFERTGRSRGQVFLAREIVDFIGRQVAKAPEEPSAEQLPLKLRP